MQDPMEIIRNAARLIGPVLLERDGKPVPGVDYLARMQGDEPLAKLSWNHLSDLEDERYEDEILVEHAQWLHDQAVGIENAIDAIYDRLREIGSEYGQPDFAPDPNRERPR
jgi:hypothetical protein